MRVLEVIIPHGLFSLLVIHFFTQITFVTLISVPTILNTISQNINLLISLAYV
jgi:hypothetical protein